MRIEASIDQHLAEGLKARGVKVRAGADKALISQTTATKLAMRARVAAALGTRVGNSVRSGIRKDPEKIAGFVYSNWKRLPASGGGKPIDIIGAYAAGATIRPVRGRWLAIPTKEVRGRRPILNVDYWAASKGIKLKFVPPRAGHSYALLVEEYKTSTTRRTGRIRARSARGGEPKVYFILVKQNRIRKRFDLGGVRRDAQRGLVDAIQLNIDVELAN